MSTKAIFAAVALTAVLIRTDPSMAAGAVAVGQPSDIAKQGVSYRETTNYKTMDQAKAAALTGCKSNGSDQSKALCQVVATFSNQCVAEAYDPQTGTPGFGWAIGDTTRAAADQAMANCRSTAGPSRQTACQIADKVLCDGKAK
jgi:hypothetical protein